MFTNVLVPNSLHNYGRGYLKKEMGKHLDFCITGVIWVSTVKALHWDIPSKSYGLPGHPSKVLPNP